MFKYVVVVLAALLAVAFAAPKPGLAYTSGVVATAPVVSAYSAPVVSTYSAAAPVVAAAYGAHPVAYGAYGAYGYGAPLAYY